MKIKTILLLAVGGFFLTPVLSFAQQNFEIGGYVGGANQWRGGSLNYPVSSHRSSERNQLWHHSRLSAWRARRRRVSMETQQCRHHSPTDKRRYQPYTVQSLAEPIHGKFPLSRDRPRVEGEALSLSWPWRKLPFCGPERRPRVDPLYFCDWCWRKIQHG